MRHSLSARLILLSLLLAVPNAATAQTFYGCLYCKPVSLTGNGATCHQVWDGNGDGTQCTENTLLPPPDGPSCYTEPNPCFATTVTAGGGGSSCGARAGFCEAQCFSCGHAQ